MIAALYVMPRGPYYGLDYVDPWGMPERDAREYAGPHAVVAHPPCARWGRYWHGGPSAHERMTLGGDDGCFAAAIAAVRRWGGVLEHPEASHAWAAFGLPAPSRRGGWIACGMGPRDGWTCCVEQGHYGHRARKMTWLYVVGTRALPVLRWGPSARRARLSAGFHSAEERRAFMRPPKHMSDEMRAKRRAWLERYASETGKELACPERINKREMLATPVPFRDLLLAIARTCRAPIEAAA
jgi:hypothetical protein